MGELRPKPLSEGFGDRRGALKTNTCTHPYRNRHLHTQTQSSAHTLDVKITSLFYWEGKLLCDYDELVKLQLRRRAMGEETTAV